MKQINRARLMAASMVLVMILLAFLIKEPTLVFLAMAPLGMFWLSFRK